MQMLPEFKKWGATGLLVEYEDVLPYKEKYEVLRAKNSYRYTTSIQLMSVCYKLIQISLCTIKCVLWVSPCNYYIHVCQFFIFNNYSTSARWI